MAARAWSALSLLVLGLPAAALARPAPRHSLPWTDVDPEDRYPLDAHPRTVAAIGPLRCPSEDIVRYAGEFVPYARPVQVHRAFRERLRAFEGIVRDVAVAHYGRAPRRILHLGALACRRIRGYPTWLSEHALGNAIDIAGFEFGPVPARLRARVAPALRGPLQVSVLEHWEARRGAAAAHAAFLHALADALVERPDVFRVLLGPAYPGHANHLHLDVGPYRLVEL